MKPGRNDPCSCGSGKKFKHCCEGKVASLPPAPSPAELNQLVTLFNTRRHAELENRVSLLLEQYPDFGFGWKLLGGALQTQGKNALPAFRKAAELMPGEADAHYNLGVALKNLGLPNDAAASYRRALELKPDYAEAHSNLGNVLKDLGQLDDAVASYRRALKIKPDSADAHNNLGIALKDLGQLVDAIASYRRAVTLKPDFALAYYNLGNALKELGQLDDAVTSYRHALKIKPDFADAHHNLGAALKDLGQFDAALASYRRVLELKPDFAEVHNSLGNALNDLGQLDDAVASFRRALHLKPNYAEAHGNLGIALRELGQLDGAVASCRRATELKPDFAEAHNNLGIALTDIGQLDSALASYRRALEIKPDFTDAHRSLGNVLKDLGQLDAALSSHRKAVELKPNYAEAHSSLGITLLLTGQFSEGWKEYWWGIIPQERLNYPIRPLSDNPLFTRRPDELLPSNLQGMHITILMEQGLGDELFFLRFAKELQKRGAWVVYVAAPRLASFIRQAKWVDYVAEKGEVIGDSHVVLMVSELPLVLGMATEAEIPPPIPLEVLPEKRQEIALRLATHRKKGRPLIGITWRAGVAHVYNKYLFKEIPLEQLAAALRRKQATFVVVQRNPQPGEITAFEAALGQSVVDFSDLNDDLEGMLALMEQLDDYIGVSNTNMHLRASVGKTARVLVPHLRDFRWMEKGDSSPWFPGFTVYRRSSGNNWDSALKQLECHILPDQIR